MTRYEPSGLLEAVTAFLLRSTLQLLLKPVFSPRWSIGFQRRWLYAICRLTLVPRSVVFEQAVVGGVPGEWVRPKRAERANKGCMLFLHGGAYCVGAPGTHHALAGNLARAMGCPVFLLDYRLAPEHRFPAAVDDALAAFKALHASGPVVVAGDSAGGGLSLACALALREANAPAPAALVLFSPWVDMNPSGVPATLPAGEAMLSTEWALACAAHYLGDTPPTHPFASPLHADLHGLPPTLIQAGTDEMLHDQAVALEQALMAAKVEVRCEITARRWHVFQVHGGALRSADEAIARAAEFSVAHLSAAAQAA